MFLRRVAPLGPNFGKAAQPVLAAGLAEEPVQGRAGFHLGRRVLCEVPRVRLAGQVRQAIDEAPVAQVAIRGEALVGEPLDRPRLHHRDRVEALDQRPVVRISRHLTTPHPRNERESTFFVIQGR